MDCAIKANRIFEAFLIAYSHPSNREYYIEYVVERFSLGYSDDFLAKFLKPLTLQRFDEIIGQTNVEDWKDAITFIVKNVKSLKERKNLYNILIEKLKKEGHQKTAGYVYIFNEMTEQFLEQISEDLLKDSSFQNLKKNYEILLFYTLRMKIKLSGKIIDPLFRFCNILLDKGYVTLSYEFMEQIADQGEMRVKEYLIRLQHFFLPKLAFKHLILPKRKVISFQTKKPVKPQPIPKNKPTQTQNQF